jgi:hypothetical protein
MRDREACRDDRILALFNKHGTLTLWGVAAILHRSKNRRATYGELTATRTALNRLVARGLLETVGPSYRWTFRASQGAADVRSAPPARFPASDEDQR